MELDILSPLKEINEVCQDSYTTHYLKLDSDKVKLLLTFNKVICIVIISITWFVVNNST